MTGQLAVPGGYYLIPADATVFECRVLQTTYLLSLPDFDARAITWREVEAHAHDQGFRFPAFHKWEQPEGEKHMGFYALYLDQEEAPQFIPERKEEAA